MMGGMGGMGMGGMGGMGMGGMGGLGMGGHGGLSPIPGGYGSPAPVGYGPTGPVPVPIPGYGPAPSLPGYGPGFAPAPGYGSGSMPGNVWPGTSGGTAPYAKRFGPGYVNNRKWLLHELAGANNVPGKSKKEPESSECKSGYSIYPNETNCCDSPAGPARCCHTVGEPDTVFCS